MRARLTRRGFLGAAASVATLSACRARAPREAHVPRVGFMIGAAFPEMTAAFEDELLELGYVQGENIVLEKRFTGSGGREELSRHAAELAAMDLDVIAAAALPQLLALRDAGSTTPTVVGTAPGLVANGFAASLERPGGNVTGMDELPPGLTAKRLGLLKAFAPRVQRVALLSTTPGKGHGLQLADAEQAAAALGIEVGTYVAASPAELTQALDAIAKGSHDGLLSFQGGLSLGLRKQIVDFANARSMPAIYQSRLFVVSGGLLAWAPDQNEQFRVAARNVDRILRGAVVGDIPIRHPERYYLSLNRATAAKLGIAPPPELLARVDEFVG